MLNTNALLEALPVAVYTTDAEGNITFYNQAAAALWGYRPPLGSKWCGSWRIFWPDGRPLPHDECPMAIALKEGRVVRGIEAVAERPDGTRVPFIPYPTPFKDEAGRVLGAINVLVDITERKLADEATLRNERELSDFFDTATIGLHWVGPDGVILRANQAELDMLGYSQEEYIGRNIVEFHVDQKRIEDLLVRLRKGETVHDYAARLRRKDGAVRDVLINSSALFENGRFVHTRCFTHDITDRKGAEELRARLATIVTSSDDAIVSKTLDGIVTSWNAGATRIFGYSSDEMLGQSIMRIIPPELHHEETAIISRLRAGERIDHYETVRVAKDGRRVDISLTVSPLRNEAGEITGASKVARDITEKKQAEKLQQLLIEELNHRVKNTLATVQAIATQSLSRSKNHKDFVSSFSGRLQALGKLHTLLTQTSMRGTDLSELVATQVRLGSADDDRVSIAGPYLFLGAQEAGHLGMVLHELATNARKYGALSATGGRIAISWEVRSNGGSTLLLRWTESGGPKVRAPETRGFGMTLIEQTVRVHGGEASMHFAEEGLTCRVEWPLLEEPQEAISSATLRFGEAPMVPAPASPSLRGKRILVVEDEPLVAMDIQSMLGGGGCIVVGPAGSLEEAKRLLETEHCDAALVDVNLKGQPIDGLLPILKTGGVPFAFVTGYGAKVLSQTFEETVTISKPFSAEQLLAVVEVLLYLRGTASDVVPLRKRRT